MLAGLACGPAALTMVWFAPDHEDQPSTTAPDTDGAAALGPAGWAERAVAAYVDGDVEAVRAAFPSVADAELPATEEQTVPTRVSTVAADRIAGDYWAVTVAVSGPREDPQTPAARYYSLGVAASGAGWVAMDFPSEVAAPVTGQPPDLPYASRPLAGGHPVAQTVQQWAGAYLAADGELARYLAPDFEQTPVSPSPYSAVDEVKVFPLEGIGGSDGVASNGAADVLARVQAVGKDDGRTHTVVYALKVAERGDRWEVSALHPAPRVDPDPDSTTDS